LLETSYAAFIARSERRSALTHRLVGVYIGLFTILLGGSFFGTSTHDAKPSLYDGTANSVSIASGRISYVLGLTGPCFPVDSACSASLVAAYLATCEKACVAAGGVLEQDMYAAFSVAGMLSNRGRCHSFDSRADGYCRGEGCVGFICESAGGEIAHWIRSTAVR
ncbi:hypothetical protein AURANDRAFT_32788, partial [Aureococcus anophagefferens]